MRAATGWQTEPMLGLRLRLRPTGPLVNHKGVLGEKALSTLKALTDKWLPIGLLVIICNVKLSVHYYVVYLYLFLFPKILVTLESIMHMHKFC